MDTETLPNYSKLDSLQPYIQQICNVHGYKSAPLIKALVSSGKFIDSELPSEMSHAKRRVNAFLATYEEPKEEISEATVLEYRNKISSTFVGIIKRHSELAYGRYRTNERTLSASFRSISTLEKKIMNDKILFQKLNEMHDEISDWSSSDSLVSRMANTCMTNHFWEVDFSGKYGGGLVFISRNDVILTEVNSSAGINRKINFGKAVIEIPIYRDFRELRIDEYLIPMVKDFSANVRSRNGYIHPYVYTNGDICWGTARTEIYRATRDFNISLVLNYTWQILSTYYPEQTPYETLYEFSEERRQEAGRSPEGSFYCNSCDYGWVEELATVDVCPECESTDIEEE